MDTIAKQLLSSKLSKLTDDVLTGDKDESPRADISDEEENERVAKQEVEKRREDHRKRKDEREKLRQAIRDKYKIRKAPIVEDVRKSAQTTQGHNNTDTNGGKELTYDSDHEKRSTLCCCCMC